MKKKICIIGGMMLLVGGGLSMPSTTDAATKTVNVTVKYVHSRYGTTLGKTTYKLKTNQKKKIEYVSFDGFNKKSGTLTLKGGKKNTTVTVKLSPKKYKYTVQFKNKVTNEIIAKSKHTYHLFTGESKALNYTDNFDFYGYESKESKKYRYDSEQGETLWRDHSIKQPAKNATKTIEIQPKLVDFYVRDRDTFGEYLYSDDGEEYKKDRFIKRAFFGQTITVKPVNYSGYHLPSVRKVKISQESYDDFGWASEGAYKMKYTNKTQKKRVTIYSYGGFQLGSIEKNFTFGREDAVYFYVYFGNYKIDELYQTEIKWLKWEEDFSTSVYLNEYIDRLLDYGSSHISLVY